MLRFISILALSLFVCLVQVHAVVTLRPYCTGLSVPVDIRNCGDDRLFVVEQPGRIRIIDSSGTLVSRPFLDLTDRVYYGGERGLLGLAFAPDYDSTGYLYVDYTSLPSGRTRISRFRMDGSDPNHVDSTSEEILLTIYQPYSNHNGGALAFSPKNGYLYIGMGDGGSANDPGNRAQNIDTLLGKLLRLEVTSGVPGYQIPSGNPFIGQSVPGRDEIWAVGMRNPWRISFDPLNGDLWIGDVGQNLYEEVDVEPGSITSGRNYGWRCYEANHTFNTTGCAPASTFTAPIWEYQHTGGNCSITGGYVYRGANYADMYGKYFFTDYCVNQMRTLTRNGASYVHTNLGSLATGAYVSFGVDRWGELYAADVTGGRIMKFASDSCQPVSAINGGIIDTIIVCDNSSTLLSSPKGKYFQYAWSIDGTPLVHDFDTLTVYGGAIVLTVSDASGCQAVDTVHVLHPALPVVSISGLDSSYCISHAPVILLPSPIGGTFSGPGISGITFDPVLADTGLHVITYSYTDLNGCTGVASAVTVVDLCSGVQTFSCLDRIRVFPNPGTGNFRISIPSSINTALKVEVLDHVGSAAFVEEIAGGQQGVEYPMDLSGLASGIYLLTVTDEGGVRRAFRLVINR